MTDRAPGVPQKVVAAGMVALALVASVLIVGVRHEKAREAVPSVVRQALDALPAGPQAYRIAQAGDRLPRIVEAAIDPLDVHVGQTQTLRIVVQDEHAITRAVARIGHDKGVDEVTLSYQGTTTAASVAPLPVALQEALGRGAVAQGTGLIPVAQAAGEAPYLVYEGRWIVHDTHDTTYSTTFALEDEAGNANEVTLAWSDACSIPQGGSWSLASHGNCTISANDGVDNGDVTIATFTLTLNADFAYNEGRGITISSGAIALCTTCGLLQTNVWQVDADADGFPANGTMYLQASAPTNGRRRNLLSATVDCNDGAFSLTNTCVLPQCWPDADGDTFFSVNATTGCTGTLGVNYSASQGNDCYDANASAKPGQTGYFQAQRGDGLFDFNCDGNETPEYNFGQAACRAEGGGGSDLGCTVNLAGWTDGQPSCGQQAYYTQSTCNQIGSGESAFCAPNQDQSYTQGCR